jgi:hypothetical protein
MLMGRPDALAEMARRCFARSGVADPDSVDQRRELGDLGPGGTHSCIGSTLGPRTSPLGAGHTGRLVIRVRAALVRGLEVANGMEQELLYGSRANRPSPSA